MQAATITNKHKDTTMTVTSLPDFVGSEHITFLLGGMAEQRRDVEAGSGIELSPIRGSSGEACALFVSTPSVRARETLI